MADVTATNIALCEALGLDAHDVRAATIRMRGGEPPRVEVEYTAGYLQRHPEVAEALRRFELVPERAAG